MRRPVQRLVGRGLRQHFEPMNLESDIFKLGGERVSFDQQRLACGGEAIAVAATIGFADLRHAPIFRSIHAPCRQRRR